MNKQSLKMKTLILSIVAVLLTSFTPVEENVEHAFFGIWRNMDNEFVQISRNMDNEITFQRIASNRSLKAKGYIQSAVEGGIVVKRYYPDNIEYSSQYVFSPSGNTLVIMKPNSDQAWLFERVGN